MSAALKMEAEQVGTPLGYGPTMTAEEFTTWAGDGFHRLHMLVDGEPVAMNPPNFRHGAINARLVALLGSHLHATGSDCAIAIEAGVQPALSGKTNIRVPDVVIACGPQNEHYARNPLVIIEILSPSNARETREAVRSCLSIPSLMEVLIVDSMDIRAEVIRRDANGDWQAAPILLGPDDDVALDSLDFRAPLRSVYPD